ncbi:helix-turn-helix domain-containing protein [Salmonella enterica subsp. enterica serovar Shubra]|uniref:transcriptional regulator n=1 Tax=Salmonella enterica TaxID=28901 RepID=UPI000DEC6F5A|nr:YdaS family helix-turn-helix protein [Salmonella enterica]AXD33652.1 hypothetical protein CHD15_13160 [Salmonella enterica]EHA9278168.1 helix-turn-helix domain-containing protein [Salmonella enterica subsp. enterica serovar Shubra]
MVKKHQPQNELRNKVTNNISLAEIGEHFGISGQAVGKWFLKGSIPPERVLPLCVLLNWSVTPHELRPDIYPNPNDYLPVEHQFNAENKVGGEQ